MAEARAAVRWTVADLEGFPDDEWHRYEILDGELLVSRAPGDDHQNACGEITIALGTWNHETRLGRVLPGPGVIFGDEDSAIPDVVWLSHARYGAIIQSDRHLHGAPELIVEVLSPGAANERCDRQVKLKRYSVYGVQEYWLVDLHAHTVAIYRRRAQLRLVATLQADDTLTSPLLPGFSVAVARLFGDD